MDDCWGKIESIFNKVLEADENRRSAVLEESCAGDEALKREVESLLAHHRNAGDFIETPAFEDVAGVARARPERESKGASPAKNTQAGGWRPGTPAVPNPAHASLKGALVAHYRVLDEIGVGGMGIVYKAEDVKLGRTVALKFLPDRLASDSVAIERFRREARAASALNHPNICTIYEIEQQDGREFIAMEFLDGQTLAIYIAGRAHSCDTVAKLGIPIAEALAAAHSKGVIHRDVKPGNIYITAPGLVKVLDFGVAKLLQTSEATPTMDTLTETNAVTGTLPYMSPEQLRGEDLDTRSDIYAFGVVLYEIATGQRPYTSSLQGKLIDEILHRPAPPPSSLNRKLPPKLDEIILKCLEKDPENRYQSAKEIAVDLRRMSTPATGQEAIPERRSKAWIWVIGAMTPLLLAAAVVWYLRPTPQPRVTGSERITDVGDAMAGPIATDGSGVYFNVGGPGTARASQVSLSGGETTDFRSGVSGAGMLDISPDHSQLLAMSGGYEGHNYLLWALPLPVGSPRRLGDAKTDDWGAAWSPDMKWLAFIRGKEVWLAHSDGTNLQKIVSAEGYAFRPVFSPDSSRIRFSARDDGTNSSAIWEVRVDGSNLHQILAGWQNPPRECCGVWTPDGRYFVFRTTSRTDWTEPWSYGDVYAVSDSRSAFHKVARGPIQLTFGPLTYSVGGFTPDGKRMLVTAFEPHPELVHYDSASKKVVPFLGGIAAQFIAFSHDGKRIAYVKLSDDTLWTSRADGKDRLQLTYPPDHAWLPRWSPDGTQIAFMRSQIGKPWKAALIASQGGTAEELAPGESSESTEWDPNWSPDGTRIVFSRPSGASHSDLRIMDLKTQQISIVPGSAQKFSPRWSPNGRYLAALALSTFSKQLYIFDFRTGKWSDWTTDAVGIQYPAWTSDSRYVQYHSYEECKRVGVGESRAQVVFKGLGRFGVEFGGWGDMAPDGSEMFVRNASTQDIYALHMDFP